MSASEHIEARIMELGDWRADSYAVLRNLINDAGAGLEEDWKWNTPVWSRNGLVCAISAHKTHVKINFFKGVHLDDPKKLINNGLDSKEHRSIDFFEGDIIPVADVQELVRAAACLNIK